MTKFLETISKKLVQVLFTLIIGGLTAISLINTCYVTQQERLYYTFVNCTSILLVFGFLFLLYLGFIKGMKDILEKIRIKWVLAAALALGSFYILISQAQPLADQKMCLMIAEQMSNHNFDAFQTGGYMQTYPQQAGLVFVYYVLGFIFGTSNVAALQILNVIAYACFIYCIYLITKKLFTSHTLAIASALLSIAFIPLLFYTSFIYGTMIGLAASTFAIYKTMVYIDSRKWTDAISLAFFAGISVLVKRNYIIVIISIFIILLLHAICKKHIRAVFCMILLLVFCTLATCGVTFTTQKISKAKIGDGLPSIAWVTMGMQEGGRANGWYNGYSVNLYHKNKMNSEKTAAAAKKDLLKRIRYFKTHPAHAASFFATKTATQWSEPSFQCFFIIRSEDNAVGHSPAFIFFTHGKGKDFLYQYMDILQSLIYMGILFYFLYEWRRIKLWDLLPAIVFLGGFLFHLVWEAKGQYTITYFVLLFPYCMKGYSRLFYSIKRITAKHKEQSAIAMMKPVFPLLLCVVLCISYLIVPVFNSTTKSGIKKFNSAYQKQVLIPKATAVPLNGTFRIRSFDDSQYVDLALYREGDNMLTASLTDDVAAASSVTIREESNRFQLTADRFNLTFSSIAFEKIQPNAVHGDKDYYSAPTNNMRWTIKQGNDGSYYIRANNNYALTRCKDNKLSLQKYNAKNRNQKWALENVVNK